MEHRGVKVLLCLAAVLVLGFSAWADSIVVGTATGTGFIVSSEGYILTNEHVVEKATEVKVTIGAGEYTATVVATLPGSDLALLKVDARGLPAVHLGNSDQVDIGDEVYALGCPGGVCGTATMGRIANIGVSIRTDGERVLQNMLMVDITTDHGSSGGPLVNSRGEVVGITTAGRQGAFGFSIPINQAIPLLQRIPGFSTAQMGRRTQDLTFREIRALVGPSTTFVVAPVTLALTSLLPTAIPGYDLLIEPRAFVEHDGSSLLSESFFAEMASRYVFHRYSLPDLPSRLGTRAMQAAIVSGKRTDKSVFWFSAEVAALGDRPAAERAAAQAIRTAQSTITSTQLPTPQVQGSERGTFSLLDAHCQYEVAWVTRSLHAPPFFRTVEIAPGRHGPPILVEQGFQDHGLLVRGTTTMTLDRLVLVLTFECRSIYRQPNYSAILEDQVLYTYNSGCFARQVRTARFDPIPYVSYTTGPIEALICLPQFMAEFERVFLIAVKALLDGLPKG